MIRIILLASLLAGSALSQSATPALRHLWLEGAETKTQPEALLSTVAAEYGLSPAELSSLQLAKDYTTAHNGVRHLIYRQQWQGVEVSGAEWVINIDREGNVLNAGGKLYPNPGDFSPDNDQQALRAMRAAVVAINPKLSKSFSPRASLSPRLGTSRITFARTGLREDVVGEPVWIPTKTGLKSGWRFVVAEEDSPSRYFIDVDSGSLAVSRKRPLVFYQTGPRGLVYEKGSPQPNPTPGTLLKTAPPIVERTLQPFTGDPIASPRGWTNGVATSGNNTVTGENLTGTAFLLTPTTASGDNGVFSFPIQVGNPLSSGPATTTNLFYWINRAHDLHYAAGFDEASGNFQMDNFGRGGTGGDPVYAYSHYGAQNFGRASINNAFFSVRGTDDDGGQPMVAMFVSTGGLGVGGPFQDIVTDGSLDATIIIHEYSHGVSTRLARQVYNTFQGAAMGEGWSDFFGLEYTLPDGTPTQGQFLAGEYFEQAWPRGIVRSRPYSTDLALNPLTYANLGGVLGEGIPEVHADGEIWVEALWEMRANLIAQFGDKEGRRRARILVIDGMKLELPEASMVDARDGILLADRVDFKGESQAQIWAAFAKRGLGALAYSANGQTVHVASSFDLPSNAGKIRFHDQPIAIGERIRLILQDSNLTRPTVLVQLTSSAGDVEDVILKRTGSTYYGELASSPNVVNRQNGTLNIMPNDQVTAYYVDENTGSGAVLVQNTIDTIPAYTALGGSSTSYAFSGETQLPLGTDPMNGEFVKTPVVLGFDFPFFDKKYKTAYVYSNGLIGFGPEAADPFCTDDPTFRSYTCIAPMWTVLEIEGSAQPREGVFISRTAKSVTFRWAGETYLADAFTGTPINFAATLYDDGRIVFQYPNGQQFPQQSTTYIGCSQSPVIGLSNGHEAFAQSYSISQFSNLVVSFEPAFGASSIPSGRLESPAAGASAQGILTVSGVAFDSTPLLRIDILIDGVQRGQSSRGFSRPDACTPTQPGCPNVGFSQSLNLGTLGLAPGQHTIRVRVTNRRGSFIDLPTDGPRTFTVEAGQSRLPVAKIESPVDGARITGALTLTGYALIETLRVTAVDVLIDGLSFPGTRYGLARADVCTALKSTSPNCPGVGFSASIQTRLVNPPIANGKHSVQIRVRDETGRTTVFPDAPLTIDVQNGDAVPVFGAITSVKPNDTLSGIVAVTGYAYSPGRTITSGTVLLDGFPIARVTLNQPATEACATLTDANACPNIGFRYNLDTRLFLDGPHLLGIRFVTDRGDNIIIPNTNSYGMNITIDN